MEVAHVHRHAHPDAVRLDDWVISPYGYDFANGKEKEELVNAVSEEADNEAGDHLLAPGPVVQLAGEEADKSGDGQSKDKTEDQLPKTAEVKIGDAEVADQEHGQLAAHRPDDDAKVEAQTGDYGNDQGKDDESIPIKPAGQLRDEKVDGHPGRYDKAQNCKGDKDDGHGVIRQKRRLLADKTLYLFHYFAPPLT